MLSGLEREGSVPKAEIIHSLPLWLALSCPGSSRTQTGRILSCLLRTSSFECWVLGCPAPQKNPPLVTESPCAAFESPKGLGMVSPSGPRGAGWLASAASPRLLLFTPGCDAPALLCTSVYSYMVPWCEESVSFQRSGISRWPRSSAASCGSG